MSGVNSSAHWLKKRRCFTTVERPIADLIGQAPAFDVLHREIMAAVDFSHVVDGDEVVVLKAGRGVCLSLETVHHPTLRDFGHAAHAVGADDFQSDQAIRGDLPSLVNDSHPALTERTDQFVVTKFLAGTDDRPSGRLWLREPRTGRTDDRFTVAVLI